MATNIYLTVILIFAMAATVFVTFLLLSLIRLVMELFGYGRWR